MNILVTGNLGYVGPCVIARLRAAFPGAGLIGLDAGYFADALLDPASLPDQVPDEQILDGVRGFPARRLKALLALKDKGLLDAELRWTSVASAEPIEAA
jgi:nucleoside-diphosphate-sugar epimerase